MHTSNPITILSSMLKRIEGRYHIMNIRGLYYTQAGPPFKYKQDHNYSKNG